MKILGTPVSLEQLAATPAPAHTSTWKPLSFHAVVVFLMTMCERAGLTIESADFGLNKTGQRFIGYFTFAAPTTAGGLTIPGSSALPSLMVRGCYDKAWAWSLAIGARMVCCQNGIFSTDGVKMLRRNTLNVWGDFRNLATSAVDDVFPAYRRSLEAAQMFSSIACGELRGAALVGVARYKGLLTPTQETVVMTDWQTPRHPEFAARNLWSLYNCGTEGLKSGAFDNAAERHSGWHAYLSERAAIDATAATVAQIAAPAPDSGSMLATPADAGRIAAARIIG